MDTLEKIIMLRDAEHGDWKTASVRPEAWPTLNKGTEVEYIKDWNNFYGLQRRVIGPNGNIYDIPPSYTTRPKVIISEILEIKRSSFC